MRATSRSEPSAVGIAVEQNRAKFLRGGELAFGPDHRRNGLLEF